jgi:hypothetical protein
LEEETKNEISLENTDKGNNNEEETRRRKID